MLPQLIHITCNVSKIIQPRGSHIPEGSSSGRPFPLLIRLVGMAIDVRVPRQRIVYSREGVSELAPVGDDAVLAAIVERVAKLMLHLAARHRFVGQQPVDRLTQGIDRTDNIPITEFMTNPRYVAE